MGYKTMINCHDRIDVQTIWASRTRRASFCQPAPVNSIIIQFLAV